MIINYSGGDIYAAVEPGVGGHDKTIVSVELRRFTDPTVVDMGRPLTKDEVEQLIQYVASFYNGSQ